MRGDWPPAAILRLARCEAATREALAIIDNAARESLLDQEPYHAIALLTEPEQRRLYALLNGDAEPIDSAHKAG